MKKYASIDIGTNTLRLLVAEAPEPGLRPVACLRRITRLGGGYREAAGIDKTSAERAFGALSEFSGVIKELKVEKVFAAATSVVRRAANRDWFTSEVKRRTGIDVSVISGDEEARLCLAGVLSVLRDSAPRKLVMDIGGGSTEFIAAGSGGAEGVWSMEMGVVHLSERHLASDPPSHVELKAMADEIGGVMRELKRRMRSSGADPDAFTGKGGVTLVGTAGTITTLAALYQGLERYDPDKINNYTLTEARIREMYEHLASLTLKQRQGILSLEKGREDLIIPGAMITLLAMEAFAFHELKVSDAGLLEGLIIDGVGDGALDGAGAPRNKPH